MAAIEGHRRPAGRDATQRPDRVDQRRQIEFERLALGRIRAKIDPIQADLYIDDATRAGIDAAVVRRFGAGADSVRVVDHGHRRR